MNSRGIGLALILSALLAACSLTPTAALSKTESEVAIASSSPAEATLPAPTDELRHPQIGVEYEYVTFTHCAFTGINVDGEWWAPIGGPIGREGTDKFDFNWDRGTVVLTDSTHATYTSSKAYVVQVEPWGDKPLPSQGVCA